ncbi:hypothetical protein BKA69DRAFT_1176671 [Paraphysoderma sedebokerense]|nr:hypothetical protein BKA69DRAFT_1176671 [Paraphysoderma sedebokerense]
MCGRTALAMAPEHIQSQTHTSKWVNKESYRTSYNVPPTRYQPVLLQYSSTAHHKFDAKEKHDGKTKDDESKSPRFESKEERSVKDDTYEKSPKSMSKEHLESKEGMEQNDRELEAEPEDGERYLQSMRWGLIPHWMKSMPDFGGQLKTINVRDDSLIENKPMYRGIKHTHRCVVLAEGFFEWQKTKSGKVPYFVKRKDGGLLMLAGLWDRVKFEDGKEIYSYTIVTTSSHSSLSFLHDRMPVILSDPEAMSTWLDPNLRWCPKLEELLQPNVEGLEWYIVDSRVGKVGVDEDVFVRPWSEVKKEQANSGIGKFFVSADGGKIEKGKKEQKEFEGDVKAESTEKSPGKSGGVVKLEVNPSEVPEPKSEKILGKRERTESGSVSGNEGGFESTESDGTVSKKSRIRDKSTPNSTPSKNQSIGRQRKTPSKSAVSEKGNGKITQFFSKQ